MTDLFISFFIFIFGLAVGSFLNCVIYRLEISENFFRGRSYCPYCKHILSWQDLIPFLSFVLLKGKCRYCQKQISWQYPIVEISTGILFVLILNYESGIMNYEFFNIESILNSLFLILASSFLIIIFVYDLKYYVIPDKIIYPAIILAFLYQLFRSLGFVNWNLLGIWNLEFGILRSILSSILAFGFFLSIVFISKGKWMGLGDVKLAALMGLILNWPNILVSLVVAFFSGAIIGLGLIMSGKKTLKSEVPFGPFLVSGTFIALFWGQEIIQWYITIFQ